MQNDNNHIWNSRLVEDVLNELKTDGKTGLSVEEVTFRLKEYGANSLPKTKTISFPTIFFHQFLSPLIYLLVVASTLAYYLGESRDALIIIIVVVIIYSVQVVTGHSSKPNSATKRFYSFI